MASQLTKTASLYLPFPQYFHLICYFANFSFKFVSPHSVDNRKAERDEMYAKPQPE